jgi:hypothetical protein
MQGRFTLLRKNMKQRFRPYRRNGGIYYIHDHETGRRI